MTSAAEPRSLEEEEYRVLVDDDLVDDDEW
jgi:hypothetical protein